MQLASITLFSDLERRVPRKLHRSLLFFRYLQKVRRIALGIQWFKYEEAVCFLSEAFEVSEKTVRRALSFGEGRFWSDTSGVNGRKIFLFSQKKVHELFGIKSPGKPVVVQMVHLRGSISNFRKVIYAMKLHLLTEREDNDMLTREQVAEGTGVSVTSTKKMEDPWVEVMPCVEPLGKTKDSMFMPPVPVSKKGKREGVKLWPASDGTYLVVRQSRNRYRSRLAGFGSRPFTNVPRDWLIMPQFEDLMYVPADVHPVGALVIDVDYEQEAFGEEEEAFTVCTAPLIVVPVGWHR